MAFQPAYVEAETPAGKRAKLDKSMLSQFLMKGPILIFCASPPQAASDKLWPLTILAEVLGDGQHTRFD